MLPFLKGLYPLPLRRHRQIQASWSQLADLLLQQLQPVPAGPKICLHLWRASIAACSRSTSLSARAIRQFRPAQHGINQPGQPQPAGHHQAEQQRRAKAGLGERWSVRQGQNSPHPDRLAACLSSRCQAVANYSGPAIRQAAVSPAGPATTQRSPGAAAGRAEYNRHIFVAACPALRHQTAHRSAAGTSRRKSRASGAS